MANEKLKKELMADTELDMTPMIDVTFLLIIFFMLVTEMADNTKEQLSLPRAASGETDSHIPGRMVINIDEDGEIEISGVVYNMQELDELLKIEKQISFDMKEGFPRRAIMIRVDEATEFRHVAKVMYACMKHQLWKLMFAARTLDYVG